MAEKKRILLLDDSTITLEMEQAVLEERGYAVAVASNLLEFQALLEQFQPEVILTDLMMPDVSGKDIVRVLKQDFHTEKIPIILFSSRPDEELRPSPRRPGRTATSPSRTASTSWATSSTSWWNRSSGSRPLCRDLRGVQGFSCGSASGAGSPDENREEGRALARAMPAPGGARGLQAVLPRRPSCAR